jgi:hypothetical protein
LILGLAIAESRVAQPMAERRTRTAQVQLSRRPSM